MKSGSIEAKIASIEAQLKILKASEKTEGFITRKKGLRSLKGILKGEGSFRIEELEAVKIRFKEEI